MGDVATCGICYSDDLDLIFDLGMQPLAEQFGTPARDYPLELLECRNCGLVQLSYIVDEKQMFPADHPYTTATSGMQMRHFADLAIQVLTLMLVDDVWVDIGANDGSLLQQGLGHGTRRVAVEPTGQARKCREKGIITYQEFFTAALARQIRAEHGPAKVITACNVLAHVPDPHNFMTGVTELLAPDGVFITENHDLTSITAGLQFDAIYHEHLRYYSVATLARLLEMHGLGVDRAERIRTYGGSFQTRASFRPSPASLEPAAAGVARALRELLNSLTPRGEVIYGVGAATRASTLIHYAKLQPYLTCVCERMGSEKIGKMMPGTTLAIVDEVALTEDQPEYALLLSYHLAGDIIPKLKAMGYKGRFIVPLPVPEVTDGG